MSRDANIGIGVAALVVVVAVVVVGPGAGLFTDTSGSPSRLDELGPEFAGGRAEIEAVVNDAGSGSFTSKSITICEEGSILRLGSGRTAAVEWAEDKYSCDVGSFIVRVEWKPDAETAGSAVQGTWTITSGADDYGDLIGEGTVELSTTPGQPDFLLGTIGYDF